MENGENQQTFIRHSELAFPRQDTVWYSETVSNEFVEPPCLTMLVTMFHAERQCLILPDNIRSYLLDLIVISFLKKLFLPLAKKRQPYRLIANTRHMKMCAPHMELLI